MKYMALIYDAPVSRPDPTPGTPEFAAMMEPWEKLTQIYIDAGIMGGGEALMPVETATSVRVRGGKTETMDGPFAETKEQLGGFYILDCKDLDEALHYAAMIPVAETGTIEVRPVMDLG
ncbi:YciI family protein [Aliiroseovarius subalbicans]|uniref:YciI family protein n=1 Tax=Aliiroseovarius subalbicans TaxID=2925840 RepID=UPI001F58C8E1|nr:YciI family protein [Aliiroseovarius subalbicans]MCI2398800.1 YciI family protein [Aliiroseovarius subalbicans]